MARRFWIWGGTLFLLSSPALPHGGVDAQGCHTERRTGQRHCHETPDSASAPVQAPARAAVGSYYPNCAAVRAAGRAPLRRGEPGYRSGLDRDNDGIACEPYR